MPRPPTITPHKLVISLTTGHFDQYAGYRAFRPNGTPDWLLILTLDGLGRFGHGVEAGRVTQELIVSRGDVILLKPGTYHDYGVEPKRQHWELLWTHFLPRADWLDWLNWPEVAPGILRLRASDPKDFRRLQTRFDDVHLYASGARMRGEALAMNALEELLLWCDDLNPKAGPNNIDPRIRSAMDLMARRIESTVTLDELADLTALSPSRFAHLFREQTGTTPQKFLESKRIDRAATLLRMTQLSIKEIAAKVGYASPFYFTLRFKKQTGQSPTAYRNAAPHPVEPVGRESDE